MHDTFPCRNFRCRYADNCPLFQCSGFSGCSGDPAVTLDGACANFMCECCDYHRSSESVQEFSDTAIH